MKWHSLSRTYDDVDDDDDDDDDVDDNDDVYSNDS
jgi:hypothetical protein